MTDSSSTYAVTGGARIGFVNYSWPLAKLVVTADRLTVSTTMFGLFGTGTYSFSKTQILSIERYGWIPLIGEGIRITHSVADYPQKIVFWCRPNSVLSGISAIGFSPAGTSSEIQCGQASRGFPLRWAPIIALVAIWNLLIGYERFSHPNRPPIPGPLSLAALWIVFGVSMAGIRSPSVQNLLLKPGRAFGEVRPVVLLVATVTGAMAIIFSIFMAMAAMTPKTKTNNVGIDNRWGSLLSSMLLSDSNIHRALDSQRAPAVPALESFVVVEGPQMTS